VINQMKEKDMGWSFRIAQVAGIDIKIHLTFFLIVILGAIAGGVSYGAVGAAFGALLILLLFLCVTLHELGHGVAARAFGIPVREIILLPLGGSGRCWGAIRRRPGTNSSSPQPVRW
jgi:Zn-dependent protease